MTPAEISRSIAGKVEAVEAGTREISAVLSGRILTRYCRLRLIL
jgi:hypothetical protein